MFDSSMVNEPSGFEPLKFYCISIVFCILIGVELLLFFSPDVSGEKNLIFVI